MKLLIADDEDMVRNGLGKYIQLHTDRFEKIFLARNGQEALDMILRYKPEIMLLDVQMPLMDGLEVLKESRKAGVEPETIIFSGYDEFKYAQQALRFGVRDYLLKPTRSSDILNMIHTLADELEGDEHQEETQDSRTGNAIVSKAKEYIEEHYYEDVTQQQAAEEAGVTPGYLSTLFAQVMGCGFADYLNKVRVHHACAYLEQNYFKTYEIAFKVGFHDEKYFSRVFKKIQGVTPAEYKKGIKK
ncbi:MAG: response regulator [Lachnospiraceae bacterium]|nr:response regulator [Lachnospiraceae bacterium]